MILVSGASGLLGAELLGRLAAAGCAARGVDLRPSPAGAHPVEIGDLLDPAFYRRVCAGVEVVVHCAARQHHDAPRWGRQRFFAANVVMTRNLVDAAVAGGARQIVFVSSDMVYGLPPGRPLRESDQPRPIGPYGESKLESERVCLAAAAQGLCVSVLRPRLIIGPGRLGVLKRLFDCVKSGKRVPMIGDGGNRYQMVAVADVADACVCAIERRASGVFNLGSADPPSVRALLGELCRRAGSGARPMPTPAWAVTAALWGLHGVRLSPLVPEQFRIAPVDYVLDIAAAREELGWTPKLGDTEMLWQAYQTYCGAALGRRSASAETVEPSRELHPNETRLR